MNKVPRHVGQIKSLSLTAIVAVRLGGFPVILRAYVNMIGRVRQGDVRRAVVVISSRSGRSRLIVDRDDVGTSR